MNKITKKHWKIAAGIISILLIASMAACSNTDTPTVDTEDTTVGESTMEETVIEDSAEADVEESAEDITTVDEEGSTAIDTEALATELPNIGTGELSAVEVEGLLFMREEEKLARDVYLTLYDQWQMNIFMNIASSEQTHTDSVKVLLDQFGLEDPMSTDEVGVFENEVLQQLYDDLVAAGSQSLGDALLVGGAIEEIDILDLEEYISQTDNADIQFVYENLTMGSRNHLRSFVSIYERQVGETYVPQYLTAEAYEAIIEGSMETGGDYDGAGQGGQGGGQGGGNQKP